MNLIFLSDIQKNICYNSHNSSMIINTKSVYIIQRNSKKLFDNDLNIMYL